MKAITDWQRPHFSKSLITNERKFTSHLELIFPCRHYGRGMIRRCLLLPSKGGKIGDSELGFELDLTKSSLNSSRFVICTKCPAQSCSVQLGKNRTSVWEIADEKSLATATTRHITVS